MAAPSTKSSLANKYSVLLTGLAYLSFVSIGLPDGLNGVAWPSIRAWFDLPLDALGSLLVMFTAGYLISSFSSGRLLVLMNLGTLLAISCMATAASLIGYALAPEWWVMVCLAVVAGSGAGAIDAGLNTFAATTFSARSVNWLHASYGVGAAGGPAIMTWVLTAGYPWQRGYMLVGGWQFLLAIAFAATRKWWPVSVENACSNSPQKPSARASNIRTLKVPVVQLSVAVFFVYTGIEASAGIWTYTLFTQSRAISIVTAGIWIGLYWSALSIGRLLSGFVVGFVSVHRLLRLCIISIAVGATLIWLGGSSFMSFSGLVLMGLASAPIFPSMISATPVRLGAAHTLNGVGIQIAAAVLGGSLVPALIGMLAGKLGLEIICPVLVAASLVLWALFEAMSAVSLNTKAGNPALRH